MAGHWDTADCRVAATAWQFFLASHATPAMAFDLPSFPARLPRCRLHQGRSTITGSWRAVSSVQPVWTASNLERPQLPERRQHLSPRRVDALDDLGGQGPDRCRMGQRRVMHEPISDNWIAVLRAMARMPTREGTTETLTLERALRRSGRKRFRLVIDRARPLLSAAHSSICIAEGREVGLSMRPVSVSRLAKNSGREMRRSV